MSRKLLLLFSLLPTVLSYNFLVFCPLFGHSHTTFFANIADTLADAGHNVTFFTPTICRRFSNVSYVKSTKNVVHLEPSDKLAQYGDAFEDVDFSRFWTQSSTLSEMFLMLQLFNDMYTEQVNVLQNNLEILDELKKQKFDVMIFESFVTCAYPVLDYLEIETFLPATSLIFDPNIENRIGQPRFSSAIPLPLSEFDDRMTLLQRMINAISPPIFSSLLNEPSFKSLRPPHHVIDIHSLEPQASFVLTNSNPYIDYPRAVLTKNVQIGGVSVDMKALRSRKVTEQYDRILNLRPKTMLVSFGSVMHSKDMPIEYKVSMISAMKKFPEVTFIWKYEGNDTANFANGVENLEFAKWVPQRELLADERFSAFFTHAGLGSVNEVSYLGKPTIMCPLFADQMRNAKMLARHNGSIEISKYDLANSEKLENAFRRILFDESYTKAARELADQLEHQPVKPKDLVLKHAEFAARFGKLPSLDPYSRQMSFIEYFLLDVAAIIISVSLLLIYIVFRVVKLVLRWNLVSKKLKTK